jgi:chitin disaccharide deacetylase
VSRRLIVTADDVGLHPSITLAAVEAHKHGILTACSVVANGAAFEHAAAVLRDLPTLSVGVHLTLVGEKPLADREEIPSLVTPMGELLSNYGSFALYSSMGRMRLAEVEIELRRQIEAVAESGLTITHFNSHQHLHALPKVFDLVVRLACEFGVPYVRLPRDRWPRGHAGLARRLAVGALRVLASRAKSRLRPGTSVVTNDSTVGIAAAGRLNRKRMLEVLPLVRGLTELVCHPGLDDEELGRTRGWGYGWRAELDALCDPAVRSAISDCGITLVSPADVAAE